MKSSGFARATLAVGIAMAAVAAAFVSSSAGANPPPTASVTVSGGPSFVNDKTGVLYTFTVTNTSATTIGGVQIGRPDTKWHVTQCMQMPTDWSFSRDDNKCRFRSKKDPVDDIQPGDSATFSLVATTSDSNADVPGAWQIRVTRTDKFDDPNSTLTSLDTNAYSFEILDAVVAAGPATPGSPCPPSSKQGINGSTVTMVICGKNRTSAKLTPLAAQSSLSGSFIDHVDGPFTSGQIKAHSANVVLGNWANVYLATTKGTNKTVVTETGASPAATSPLTTLGGYEIPDQPPAANDDGPYTLNQGDSLTVPAAGVLANDSDPDGDPLTAVLVSGPGHASSFTLNADGSFSYTPDPSYFGADSFTYKANDGTLDSNVATVSLTVNPGVTIGDFVWEDSNGNGIQDSGEPGIAGVTLTLTGTKTAGGSVTDHATTDANGHYSFTESPGTYTVAVDASNSGPSGALTGYTATPTGSGTTATDSNPNPSGTTPATLPSGGSDPTVDFGYYRGVTIGDFVWNDLNGNGIQDVAEPGIGGVMLTLTGTTGAGNSVTDHTTTSGDGAYFFFEPPGTYTVTVDASNACGICSLKGFVATPTLQGANRAVDSNPNPSGTTPAALPSGGTDLTVGFGYFQPVRTGDFVWNDLNGNGIQDGGEPGIAGVTVTVTGTTGAGTPVSDSATTDSNGHYLIAEAPGTYTVTVDASNFAGGGALAGYTATPTLQGADRAVDSNANPSGTSPAALASGGSDLTVDFGFYQPVKIGDFIWHDHNGIQDAGEPGINGVTVTLTGTDGAGNSVTDHATTAGNGAYLFAEAPGTYTVTVDASNFAAGGTLYGYSASPTFVSLNPALDSNPNPSGTTPAALASGGSDLTIDFGYNHPPVATSDSYTTLEDTALIVGAPGVLGNDTDADSDTLHAVLVSGTSHAADFTLNPDGSFSYLPAGNYNGPDSFTYKANDGVADSNTVTVTLTVTAVNDPPSFDLPASPDQTVVEDSPAQTVSGFATNISAGPPDESGQALTFHVSNDDNGLFSAQPSIDPSSGDLTYTPAAGMTGTATVSVFLTDNGGTANGGNDTSATKTFKITVRPPNTAPVAGDQTGANTVSATEDTTKTITLAATDADGDPLTFTPGTPSHGTLDNFGSPSCSGNPSSCTETVDYHPAANYNGPDSFTFKANDGKVDSNTATVDINVAAVNDPPTDIQLSNNAIDENQPQGTTIGTLTTSDVDTGDTHTYTLASSGCGGALNDDLAFQIGTGGNSDKLQTFANLDYENKSSFIVCVRTTDSGAATFDKLFTIHVNNVNETPTDIQLSNSSIAENQPSGTNIGALTTTDPDVGDTAAYTLANSGCGGGANDNSAFQIGGVNNDKLQSAASFNFEAKSSYTVCLRTTDGGGLSFDKQFTISVTNVNEPPTDISLDNNNIDENKPSGSLVGNLSQVGDPDSGESYSFTLLTSGCSGSFPDSSSFQISGGQLQSAASFNFEDPNHAPSYTICVRVNDPGSPALSFDKQLTISINNVNDPPVDGDESVNAVGNTLLEYGSVPSPSSAAKKVVAGNLLANATDEDQPPQTLTISAADTTSAQGGSVAVTSDGAFTYVPPAGYTGPDSFNYTVSDGNGGTDTSTVAITVASRVWYVKNNAAPGGLGRSTDPFDTLAEADTAANASGDITYVYKGDGTTTGLTGGFSLLTNQKLLGEPVNLVVGADTLATGTPANRPSLSGTVTLASGSRVEALDVAGAAGGAAIAGTNTGGSDVTNVNLSGASGGVALTGAAAGTFNFTNFTISTTGGTGFLVNTSGSPTINVGSSSTENVSATGGTAVDVENANTASSLAFDQVSSTNAVLAGINLTSNGATPFSASSGSISGASGAAIAINGGSGNITYPGTLGDGVGPTATIINRTGGAITLSGNINDGSDVGGGISMSGNTGGSTTFSGSTKTLNTGSVAAFSSTGSGQTITFSNGGLNIDTTSGAGFSATGGGTVNVTGSSNTIDTTTGTALNVSSTNIGASGLTFEHISSNGAVDGISLNSTGTSGGLTVTGTGTAGTGGTIQNSTDSGVLGASTKTPSLSWMNIANNGNAVNEGGVRLINVSGTGGITSSTVTGGFEDNVYIKNDTTTATFTVQGPSCSITNNSSASGNDGINILAATSANLTATVNNCSFSGNRAVTIGADSADNSTLNVTITNNTITQGSPNHGNQGIQVSDAANGNVTFLVDSNKVGTPDGTTVSPLMNTGINIFNGSAGNAVMAGRVSNNTVFNDPTVAAGSSNGFGIRVFNSNLAQIRAKVLSNTVKNVSADYGILAESSGTASAPAAPHGRLDVDIESNSVTSMGALALDAIRAQSRNFNTVCAKIASNTAPAGGAGFFGIFVRMANSAVFDLDGWNGVGLPEAYVLSQNPGSTTGSAGTITGVPAGTCNFAGVP